MISISLQSLLECLLLSHPNLQYDYCTCKAAYRTIAKPLDPYSTTDIGDQLQAIARQAGHNIRTLVSSYTINKAYPTSL